ncbi:16S rRNA (guanine(966)-N(2))-methyltransferase RsmD [Diaminobutyricibacter tongyongensis]|uniref:16S rRNA (Guanine(966)-N(2))-methyltransferase RsmD n=1 Tax=Leifsonia tongyongensis TaxID=1268043 RepID=A0A6L9XZA1_9MICO|nr:16S rRNA (guanine(966)-N(2))-methyltransferase RsmD [Diaminobutyricibacter tongyongensis]NEN06720.1 16S rRNA (guanine(966)-N(2))-methyltransferase RsmD [Diaminobutyricibacter tongyongensis]
MTRIVAGFAGSLGLQVPKSGTRPTSDRVREAIFSALESRDAIRYARVLDLFAGSGALGLEAASRGASTVTLVERGSAAAAICRRNAAAVLQAAPAAAKPTIDVAATTVQSFLAASTAEFDLVFVDPPYELSDDELVHALKTLEPRLSAEAIVCVERSTRSGEPDWPAGLLLDRRKDYGETAVWWLSVDQPLRPSQPT